ncbi:MAG: hypothetical protein ABH856_00185 [Patescibacteria group bacterium]|nr:hypothetical protein [Patescibacteria group bacterium]
MLVLKKFNVWRYLISAVAVAVLAQFIYAGIDPLLSMDYYLNPQYKFLWNKLMMPSLGQEPTATFMYLSVLFTLITTLLFAGFYTIVKKAIPGKCLTCKGLSYGLMMFVVAGIPGYLMMGLLFEMPVGLLLLWAAEDFVIKVLGGLIIADINQ